MQHIPEFAKAQKIVVWLLVIGSFLLGIALSEFVLDGLDLNYDRQAHVIFGFFGVFTLAAGLFLRILLSPNEEKPSP